jgi:Protein of unknown function (DUF1116)
VSDSNEQTRELANKIAFGNMTGCQPALVGVGKVRDVVPGMHSNTILTSGAPLPWSEYSGGQRNAIIGGALYERLAASAQEADRMIAAGEIQLRPCQDYSCPGSITGVYTSSMSVLVVEDHTTGKKAFCNLYEGAFKDKLTYGAYNDGVRKNLDHINGAIASILGELLDVGPVDLKPIMRSAVHLGDELHSRNTAASVLFIREILPRLLSHYGKRKKEIDLLLEYLKEQYCFLRISMAASQLMADAAKGIDHSSMVVAIVMSCKEVAIRVSGLGDIWFRAPLPEMDMKLFGEYTRDDVLYAGGESCICETVGLGGFAQAAAFPLQSWVCASPPDMVKRNEELYAITVGENPEFHIPFLEFRGTPTGVDVEKVVETTITPLLDVGVPGKDGNQVGAASMRLPSEPFQAAADALLSM